MTASFLFSVLDCGKRQFYKENKFTPNLKNDSDWTPTKMTWTEVSDESLKSD